MVSAMPWHSPITCARRSPSMRVRAKPKNSANTTSGSIAPCAAAMIALEGMTLPIHCASDGAAAASALVAEACRVAVSAGLAGTSESSAGATSAA